MEVRDDEHWMRCALAEADLAASKSEVPVGCVIVSAAGELLATGHNLRETDEDPTAHAEIVAIRSAAQKLGTWRLEDTTLFVTLEPCVMCAGAMVNARVGRVIVTLQSTGRQLSSSSFGSRRPALTGFLGSGRGSDGLWNAIGCASPSASSASRPCRFWQRSP